MLEWSLKRKCGKIMVDIYLLQQLQGRLPKQKFDLNVDAATKELIDTEEFEQYIPEAIRLLKSEGSLALLDAFSRMNEKIESLDPNIDFTDDLMELFQLEEKQLDEIDAIGVRKFKEEDFSKALNCFILLTSLNPNREDYWYHEGIAAQKQSKYRLALKCYASALSINPDLIGCFLFSSQCYLEKGEIEKAKESFESAKLLETEISGWEDLISKIQKQLIVN